MQQRDFYIRIVHTIEKVTTMPFWWGSLELEKSIAIRLEYINKFYRRCCRAGAELKKQIKLKHVSIAIWIEAIKVKL